MPIINFSHQKGGVGKSLSLIISLSLKDNYDVQLLDLGLTKKSLFHSQITQS